MSNPEGIEGGPAGSTSDGGGERNEQEIRAWLIRNVAAMVEVEPEQIDIRKPLEHYGLDSMHAMHLSSDLQDWLGRKMSPTVVWDYPTIELLASHLAGKD